MKFLTALRLKEKEAIKNEFQWIFTQLHVGSFFLPMFPLGLPNIMVLREAIVHFKAPGGIERRRGPCDSGILVWTGRGNFGPVVKWVV